MTDTRIIEVNGVKIEVDLRTAKTVEHYKVGDRVKVLVKEYGSYRVDAGMIVGFDAFTERPTITVAHIKDRYNAYELLFTSINADTKDVEICPAPADELSLSKADLLARLDHEIEKKRQELKEIEQKKNYVLSRFQAWFDATTTSQQDQEPECPVYARSLEEN